MYGSNLCFGDYNNDGNLDFLEIRYDPSSKSTDVYRLTFTTLVDGKFIPVKDKYLVFQREFRNGDLPRITTIEKKW